MERLLDDLRWLRARSPRTRVALAAGLFAAGWALVAFEAYLLLLVAGFLLFSRYGAGGKAAAKTKEVEEAQRDTERARRRAMREATGKPLPLSELVTANEQPVMSTVVARQPDGGARALVGSEDAERLIRAVGRVGGHARPVKPDRPPDAQQRAAPPSQPSPAPASAIRPIVEDGRRLWRRSRRSGSIVE